MSIFKEDGKSSNRGSVGSVLGDVSGGSSYYDPSLDTGGAKVPEGSYFAHVKELSIKENVVVKGKFLSDIYNVTFIISKESSEPGFAGRDVKSKGFFRFKDPDPDKYPSLSSNSGSNKGYKELLDGLGISPEEKEVDGNTVYSLPLLNSSDAEGMPVVIKVVHDKWTNRDGEEVTTPKAISVFKWAEGKKEIFDMPF
jgi:hypothetical protein